MNKYYLAYDERYKKIHEKGLLWATREPTPEVINWVKYNNIHSGEEVCEVGCGEGRDALYLASQAYFITAFDALPTAIQKCNEIANLADLKVNWIVEDVLEPNIKAHNRFRWVYSVGTLHMLVEDADREKFLKYIYDLLLPGGRALIVTMGDGIYERYSDISTAFEIQERKHMETGKIVEVAGTSYRGVNWKYHEKELISAGFEIEKKLDTENSEYGKCMTVYLIRNQ